MAMPEHEGAVRAEEFLSGKFTRVDVEAIESELRLIWQSASQEEGDSGRPAVARACALNLVLFSRDADAESSASTLLDEIALSHPCRAILAIARPDETPDLEAWVSARCHLPAPGASRQICCEQITVRWEGVGVNQLPSVVMPLLTPDLPVFLFWRDSGLDMSYVEEFLPALDRLLVDSRKWDDLSQLSLLARLGRGGTVVVSDLAFRSLYSLRECLSSAFSAFAPDLRLTDLAAAGALKVCGDSPAQALLLTAWLAERLCWRPTFVGAISPAGAIMSFDGPYGKVDCQWLGADSAPAAEPGITAVELVMGSRTLSVRLTAGEGDPSYRLSLIEGHSVSRELSHRGPLAGESRLVGLELEALAFDPVYGAALDMASRLYALSEGSNCAEF